MDAPRRQLGFATGLALVVGVVIGLVVGGILGGAAVPTDRVSSPSLVTAAGTGCVDDPDTGGWIGQVPGGERRTVVLNLTFTHDVADVDVRGNLTERGADGYHLAVLVTPGDGGKEAPPGDCQPRTTLDATVSLPAEAGSLTVVLDETMVTRVDPPEGSFATFRTLSGNYSVRVG